VQWTAPIAAGPAETGQYPAGGGGTIGSHYDTFDDTFSTEQNRGYIKKTTIVRGLILE
jgi:hypothetical protein